MIMVQICMRRVYSTLTGTYAKHNECGLAGCFGGLVLLDRNNFLLDQESFRGDASKVCTSLQEPSHLRLETKLRSADRKIVPKPAECASGKIYWANELDTLMRHDHLCGFQP